MLSWFYRINILFSSTKNLAQVRLYLQYNHEGKKLLVRWMSAREIPVKEAMNWKEITRWWKKKHSQ
jgi:hypothetical protein